MHMTALFLLIFTKCSQKILQRAYLIVLCCVDTWFCILNIWLCIFNELQGRSLPLNIYSIISFTGIVVYQYLLIAFIAIDKFTSVYMPLRYQSLPIKRYTKVFIILNAIVSLTVAVLFLSLYFYYEKDYARILQVAAIYIWLPFDIIVLTISIAVYGYFAAVRSKLKQSNAWRQLIVSTAILLSFLLLYVIPDIIFVVAGHKLEKLYDVFWMMFILNHICDALSVIFLNREIRKRLLCCANEIIPE